MGAIFGGDLHQILPRSKTLKFHFKENICFSGKILNLVLEDCRMAVFFVLQNKMVIDEFFAETAMQTISVFSQVATQTFFSSRNKDYFHFFFGCKLSQKLLYRPRNGLSQDQRKHADQKIEGSESSVLDKGRMKDIEIVTDGPIINRKLPRYADSLI